MQIYRGVDTEFKVEHLLPKTDFFVRVCSIRVCGDGSDNVIGSYSPCTMLTTQSHEPNPSVERKVSETTLVEPKQLTDKQWSIIILLGFLVFAGLVAFVSQQVVTYISNQANRNGEL